MGTSEKTFNQVKAILSKLDRNIDELRDKRLHPQPAAVLPVPPAAAIPMPAPAPTANGRPSFGRATPIRPDRA